MQLPVSKGPEKCFRSSSVCVCISASGRNTLSRMEAQLVSGDLTLVFLSPPQEKDLNMVEHSCWLSLCGEPLVFSLRGTGIWRTGMVETGS